MTFTQLVAPDPFIDCRPGWCLQYVRQAFGAPIVEPTATAGWANAEYKHEDWNFPSGCWVPVWFSLEKEPAGHVALLAPDGSVYSTTSPWGNKATHHPNMADLLYAYSANNPLTYLGWSEDISGVRVVEDVFINVESIEETMAKLDDDDLRNIYQAVWFGRPGADLIPNESSGKGEWPYTALGSMTARINRDIVTPAMRSMSAPDIAALVPEEMIEAVAKGLAERLAK